jgi:hypothetical protein
MALSKRKVLLVGAELAFSVAAPVSHVASVAQAAPGGHVPVTICHRPPRITITVDIMAVPMHVLLHGDRIGECDVPIPPPCPPDADRCNL